MSSQSVSHTFAPVAFIDRKSGAILSEVNLDGSVTAPALTADGPVGVAGVITIVSTTVNKGKTTFTMADNAGNTTTNVNLAAQAGARTYTVPDAGASASFVMSQGAQSIAGATSFTAAVTTTRGVAAGTALKVGGLAYSNGAGSAAITATNVETVFATNYNIPANSIGVGTVIRARFKGKVTAHNGADTLTIKFKIGGLAGTALVTGAAVNTAANQIFAGEIYIMGITTGVGGTFLAWGFFADLAAAGASAVTVTVDATAIDTTIAQLLTASGTWSSNNAGNSVRMDYFSVEVLG